MTLSENIRGRCNHYNVFSINAPNYPGCIKTRCQFLSTAELCEQDTYKTPPMEKGEKNQRLLYTRRRAVEQTTEKDSFNAPRLQVIPVAFICSP